MSFQLILTSKTTPQWRSGRRSVCNGGGCRFDSAKQNIFVRSAHFFRVFWFRYICIIKIKPAKCKSNSRIKDPVPLFINTF